jgi:monothiol glutaredoxin
MRPKNKESKVSDDEAVFAKIQQDINNNDVVIFMKGTPQFPQCGFSAAVIQVFSLLGIPFKAIDVLVDPEVRQGIKSFSNWPTIPQVYVKGEFIGGCDIVREMYQKGELQTLLQEKGLIAKA